MKKIIRKSSGAMLMANPKIEIEVRYTNRPEFQKLMNDLKLMDKILKTRNLFCRFLW